MEIVEIKEVLNDSNLSDKEFTEIIKFLKSQQKEIKSIQGQSKAMQIELNREIERLEKELVQLNFDNYHNISNLSICEEENQKLREMIKEAINLPKGVEPHSYSDYKNKL